MTSFMERLPLQARHGWLGYAFAIGLTGLACLLRWAMHDRLGAGYPFLTFFPAVMLSAFLFGARAGGVAAVLGGCCAYYMFIVPHYAFKWNEAVVMAMGFYILIVLTDIVFIHLMQRANARLAVEREANRRIGELKTVMFRELQHRVANKLQVIAALLSLQKRSTTDAQAQRALDEAAQRVGMIGRISRALYDPNGAAVSLARFIEDVARDILDASGAGAVQLDMAVEPGLALSPDDAVPMALIFAETMSNILEHGYDGRGQGRVAISVRRHAEDGLCLEVRDHGRGLPPGFSLESADSLGLRIARALARQLRGDYRLEPADGGGTRALLVFPEPA